MSDLDFLEKIDQLDDLLDNKSEKMVEKNKRILLF